MTLEERVRNLKNDLDGMYKSLWLVKRGQTHKPWQVMVRTHAGPETEYDHTSYCFTDNEALDIIENGWIRPWFSYEKDYLALLKRRTTKSYP